MRESKCKYRLFIDQNGDMLWAKTIKELKEKCGGGRVFRVYRDIDGESYHVGYGVDGRWFDEYAPVLR